MLGIGSSGREYLVVTSRELFVVTRDGEVQRGDPLIAAEHPFRVVSNGIDYFVSDDYGSFHVDRTGKILGRIGQQVQFAVGNVYVATEGSAIVLLAPDGTITKLPEPRGVIMAAGDGEFAVLHGNSAGQWVRRFNVNGAQLGADIPIVAPIWTNLANAVPAMGWDGTCYVVSYGSLLGVERQGVIVLERLALDATAPVLASSRHGALAVWEDGRFAAQGHQIAAMLLRHDAEVAAARDVIVSLSEHAQTSPRIATVAGRQLAAFLEHSGEEDAIVVVPTSGGGEMLRFPSKNRLSGLRTATNGQQLFVLWAETDRDTVLWHAALVTPALQAARFDVGTSDAYTGFTSLLNGTDVAVLWNGSEFVVYGSGVDLRFTRDGTPLQPAAPFTASSNWRAPSAVFASGQTVAAYARFISSVVSAGPLGWDDVYIHLGFHDIFLETNALGTAPEIAASGGKFSVVTQSNAFTSSAGEWGEIRPKRVAANRWNTLAPHVGGAFLVTAGGTLALIGDDAIGDVTRLPEYAGRDRLLESVAPAAGPLTLAYTVTGDNAPTRIWLRDLTLPERHRATAR